jgi:N-acylneuraminate cytidylyltransferase
MFCGKPIISWPLTVATESGLFDKVIVSTDDEEIAEVAREFGAEVPFQRPALLSNDFAGTAPVVAHAIQWIIDNQDDVDFCCCIYATAPFILSDDLRRGLDKLLVEPNALFSVSVTKYLYPIQRAIRINQNNRLEMLRPEEWNSRSQDLNDAFHDAGQFYWGTKTAWLEDHFPLAAHSIPIVIPSYRVQDIDTIEDWQRAEWLFQCLRNNTPEK